MPAGRTLGVLALAGLASGLGCRGDPAAPQSTPSNAVVHFQCDWPNVGASVGAVMGAACETPLTYYNGNGWLSVQAVSGSGLDFPTDNYLLVESASTPDESWIEFGFHEASGYLPSPAELAVGDTLGYRDYFAYLLANGAAQDTHGDYFESAEPVGWGPETGGWSLEQGGSCYQTACAPDEYEIRWWTGAATAGTGVRPWTPTRTVAGARRPLVKGQVYRREILWIRSGDQTYQMRGRLYDSDNVLLADSQVDSFVSFGWYDNTAKMGDQTFTLSTPGNAAGSGGLQGFIWGNNGWDNPIGGRQPISAYAGVAFCSSWCGAYGSLPGEDG